MSDARELYDKLWSEQWGDLQRFGPEHRHRRRVVRHLLAQLEYDSVADIGCGSGQNLAIACEGRKLRRAVGTDLSSRALELAAARHPAEYRVLDIENGALPEQFDLVTCLEVIEHIRDDAKAMANMARMTGRWLLLGTVQGTMAEHEREIGHFRNYTRAGLEALVRGAGLSPVTVVEWGFPFYSPVFRAIQAKLPSPHGVAAGKYGTGLKVMAQAMYLLYFLNSWRRGDLIFVLARAGAG